MSRRRQLVWILLAVVAIASVANHLTVRVTGIHTAPQTSITNARDLRAADAAPFICFQF